MSRPVWAARRARAAQLLRGAPHVEEILVFYVKLTEIQEQVAKRVPVHRWLEIMRADDEGVHWLRPDRMPPDELLPIFDDFLRRVAHVGTDVITAGARAILESDAAARHGVLTDANGFHARAFLEPVMTTLAAADPRLAHDGDPGRCPRCGSLPVVGLLRDLPDALGARSLACALCATEWRIDRLRCINCGETAADNLVVHTTESTPHVRVDECRSCRRYIKTVDLRQRGDAAPVVDELATVELDLWARERGLEKLQKNVLEL